MSVLKTKAEALQNFSQMLTCGCWYQKMQKMLPRKHNTVTVSYNISMLILDLNSKITMIKNPHPPQGVVPLFSSVRSKKNNLWVFAIFRRTQIVELFTLMNHRGTAVVAQMHWMRSTACGCWNVVSCLDCKIPGRFCTPHSHTSFGCQRLFSSGVPMNDM